MKNKKNILTGSAAILFFISILSWTSCVKTVKFHLKNSGSKLVVEGAIETNTPPVVRLSKSIGFFSEINLQNLSDAFVHGANITVSNGSQTVSLVEYHFYQNGVPLYFYSIDTANAQALQFVGIPGASYQLTIQYQGKTYHSETTIPFVQPLDSIWSVMPPPEEMPEDYPDSREIFAQYTDPDTPGNYARYFTKRNSEPYLAPLYSVYNDEVVNGKTVQFELLAGFPRMDSINPETFGYFYKGDTVVIKWCGIDKSAYDFWQTLEYSYSATGNPFATPVEISTNIEGGALGVWVGYNATYDTLIISQ